MEPVIGGQFLKRLSKVRSRKRKQKAFAEITLRYCLGCIFGMTENDYSVLKDVLKSMTKLRKCVNSANLTCQGLNSR